MITSYRSSLATRLTSPPSRAVVVVPRPAMAECSSSWRVGHQIAIDDVVNRDTPIRPERSRPNEDQVSTVAPNK